MTNLEFINLEIATVKKDYKRHINFGQTNFAIADEKRLNQLQQIKAELEAWEVVKLKEVDLYDVIHTTNYKQYKSENNDLLKQYFLNEKEYKTIKKALEVE